MPSARAFPTATSITPPSPRTKWSSSAHQKTPPRHSANALQLMVQDQEGTLPLFIFQRYPGLLTTMCCSLFAIDRQEDQRQGCQGPRQMDFQQDRIHTPRADEALEGTLLLYVHATPARRSSTWDLENQLEASPSHGPPPKLTTSLSFQCWL